MAKVDSTAEAVANSQQADSSTPVCNSQHSNPAANQPAVELITNSERADSLTSNFTSQHINPAADEPVTNFERADSLTSTSTSQQSNPTANINPAADDPVTSSQRAVSSTIGSNSQPRDPAAELRDTAVELLEAAADQLQTYADHLKVAADQGGTVAQQAEVAATEQLLEVAATEQLLKAAADRQGEVAAPAKQLRDAADQLKVAAGQLGTAKGEHEGTVARLSEAANKVRIARLGLTALTAADLADLEELELYLTEKKLQDTRDQLLHNPAEKNPGIVDFEEITNLVIIDRYPKLKKALELWYQRDKDLKAKIAQKEARRSDVRNQIYNIIGWYAVYLGVVLTAVSQLTQTSQDNPVPVCKKYWFPILLTLLGVLVTIAGLWVKFRNLSSLESTIADDRKTSDELNRRALRLGRVGLKFNFLTEIKETRPVPTNWYNLTEKISVCLALLAFAGVFIASYFVILCDSGT